MKNSDSGFYDKEFITTPYLKLLEDKDGATGLCYQMRLHGKLHFVKKIKPEFENDARMRAAFRKENEIGFSLSHPNLPRYLFMEGIFSPEEYVVTEWLEGETLDKFIEHNPKFFCERNNIKRLINQLADALDYLHQNGILHGDLKPSNIMLTKDGERAILLDLGFSISDAHTLTGGFTYDFAAPELINGESATETADYFSLGKIIEFIKNHTKGKLPKEIVGLKEALINPDRFKRSHSLEEIKEVLDKKRGKWVWFTILPFLGLLVWFILDIIYKESSYETDIKIIQQPIIQKEIDKYESSISSIEEPQLEDIIYHQGNKVTLGKTEKINIESEKENIKDEVNRLLKLNYTPHMARIDSLVQEKDFTMDWYLKIVNESADAMVKSIKDSYYYEKYPSVPKDEVIYILSTEFSNFCNNIWNPKMENYYKNIPK
ncbi:MAG: protein kinase [Muribaculaceae bacterium]|nr:protein kinase [Muribaculaceae bacterium]